MLCLCNILIDSDEKSTVIVLFFEIGGNEICLCSSNLYNASRDTLFKNVDIYGQSLFGLRFIHYNINYFM